MKVRYRRRTRSDGFIEAPAFSRHLSRYLDDEQYRSLQDTLAGTPELGDVIPGTGGFRKLRWADTRRNKGRRGGLRVIYFGSMAKIRSGL
jgi:hypothetical protein